MPATTPQQTGTFEALALGLARLFSPLEQDLADGRVKVLLAQLGLQLPAAADGVPAFSAAVQSMATAAGQMPGLITQLIDAIEAEDTGSMVNSGRDLASSVVNIIKGISDLSDAVRGLGGATGIPPDVLNDFANQLPKRLVDYLVVRNLEGVPVIPEVLEFIGVVGREVRNSGSADPNLPEYTAYSLHFDHLNDFIKSPLSRFRTLYDWGNPGFDASRLLPVLQALLGKAGIPAILDTTGPSPVLDVLFAEVSAKTDVDPRGLLIKLVEKINVENAIPFNQGGDWELEALASGDIEAATSLVIQPNGNFIFTPPAATADGKLGLRFTAGRGDEAPFIIFGSAGSSRIEVGKFIIGTEANLNFDSATNSAQSAFRISGEIKGGKLLIDVSNADGFIGQILSGIRVENNFDLGLGFSSEKGLFFHGSSVLEVQLALHISLGPVEINGLSFFIGLENGKFPVGVAINLKTNLGPLKGVIEHFGIKADLTLPDNRNGNLGPLNFALGFKPPKGIGLSLDAGPVRGGGYLYFDFDREEYAGALELVFSEWIALKAIGVVTTKMPDGSKGFSMVIIITAEFGSGLQLGFGFTLLGVGGIVGINRVVNVEPLKVGVRTGALESILFPQDVVANAPRIISDLKAFFPVREGQFLIGPMAKIGYGTPTLASLSLGLIIEFPDVNITILGVLKVALPTEEADILRLQVNFLGRIEPANSLLWFYAELYDSRILFITLEGGMGLLVNWGDNANFVFSVGGFHPQYTPPPLPFPSPPRLAVNILNESFARVRIEGYFAVTSNSVQFGAHVVVFFGVDAFNIDGHFGFDALFQFDPFYFSFSLTVSLSVKLFGIGLFSIGFSGLIEGPTPWHIKGHGSIGFLFFSVSVPFEETWGEPPATPLTPIDIFPLIEREFTAITNWQAVVPKGSSILVTLRKLEEPAAPAPQTNQETDTRPLVLHPVGSLRISQRKMPINFKMDKLGSQKPADVDKILIGATIAGASGVKIGFVKEKFARGEYQNLDQAKKLSSPGFEMYDGGIELKADGGQLQTSMAVKRVIRYETIIIDSNYKRHAHRFFEGIVTRFGRLTGRLFGHFIKGSVVTQSTLSATYQQRIQPNAQVIAVAAPTYSVAYTMDNSPMLGANGLATASFASKAEAVNFMQSQIVGNPRQAGALHVIPNTELNQTAAA